MKIKRDDDPKKRVKIKPEMAVPLICLVVDSAFRRVGGTDAVLTSVIDGKHKVGSLHYKGLACDFRISQVLPETLKRIEAEIRLSLSEEFDVVLEKDHLHIEFDPK